MSDELRSLQTLINQIDLRFQYHRGKAFHNGLARFDAILKLGRTLPRAEVLAMWTEKVHDTFKSETTRDAQVEMFELELGAAKEPIPTTYSPPKLRLVIHDEAGWTPDPRNEEDLRRQMEIQHRKNWEHQVEHRIRQLIWCFDSGMKQDNLDLMQLADGMVRLFDNIRLKKQEKGLEVRSEMNDLERAGIDSTEFNETKWMELDQRLKQLRASWAKMTDGFNVAMIVRHAVNGHTDAQWGEYTPASEFKARRAKKLVKAHVDASQAVGLDAEQFQSWQAWRIAYNAEHDGVDAHADEAAGMARDQKSLADRQHQQKLAEAGAEKKYLRQKPTTVPKADTSYQPSGTKGSRHAALEAAAKKAKKAS